MTSTCYETQMAADCEMVIQACWQIVEDEPLRNHRGSLKAQLPCRNSRVCRCITTTRSHLTELSGSRLSKADRISARMAQASLSSIGLCFSFASLLCCTRSMVPHRLRVPLCQCTRAVQASSRISKGSPVGALHGQRGLHTTFSTREAATSGPLTPLELSGLNKNSQEAEKQKNESTAVRALDRLSSALRIKEAGNERHHKLSRIRGGGN